MSKDNFIEQYKNIKAPEELLERIENAQNIEIKKNNVIPFKKHLSIAASLVLVVALSFVLFLGNGKSAIYVDGAKLYESATLFNQNAANGISVVRGINSLSVHIETNLSDNTQISVDDGFVTDENGEIILPFAQEKTFSEKFSGVWNINLPDTSKTYKMTLKSEKDVRTLSLYFNSEENIWYVSLLK